MQKMFALAINYVIGRNFPINRATIQSIKYATSIEEFCAIAWWRTVFRRCVVHVAKLKAKICGARQTPDAIRLYYRHFCRPLRTACPALGVFFYYSPPFLACQVVVEQISYKSTSGQRLGGTQRALRSELFCNGIIKNVTKVDRCQQNT